MIKRLKTKRSKEKKKRKRIEKQEKKKRKRKERQRMKMREDLSFGKDWRKQMEGDFERTNFKMERNKISKKKRKGLRKKLAEDF